MNILQSKPGASKALRVYLFHWHRSLTVESVRERFNSVLAPEMKTVASLYMAAVSVPRGVTSLPQHRHVPMTTWLPHVHCRLLDEGEVATTNH